jgi:hypothetical protein
MTIETYDDIAVEISDLRSSAYDESHGPDGQALDFASYLEGCLEEEREEAHKEAIDIEVAAAAPLDYIDELEEVYGM